MKNNHSYQPYGDKKKYAVLFLDQFPKSFDEIKELTHGRLIIFYDTNISNQLIKKLIKLFQNKQTQIKIIPFKYGPKSLPQLVKIWEALVDFVPDLVIGIGGGTISDLIGFAASTYQRGVPHIIFPTTILGMIDAALGGKTAIDFHGVKNCIGAVHYPLYTINLMEFLQKLPQREFFSGFSEAIKAGVLFDANFLNLIEKYAKEKDFNYKNKKLLEIMKLSAQLKMKNSEDPSAHKIKLLYGHAIGHAIEIISNGKIKHGEAVSIGMTIEGGIACELGIWKKAELEKQTKIIQALHLPTSVPKEIPLNLILQKMKLYKKLIRQDQFGFIFPEKIGRVHGTKNNFVTFVDEKKIKIVLQKICAAL